jgi:uncharacterized protein (DUF697 family)/GTP-binding protein EngB required for normal cell division
LPNEKDRRVRIRQALQKGRSKLEQGAKDIGDAVAHGVQEMAERTRRSSRDTSPRSKSTAQVPDAEDVAIDPAAFFNAEQKRQADRLGCANILISGQAGVGKSTLINAVFRVRLADEGIGKPVTKHVQRYHVPGVPVTIFDTPGIELGQAKDDVIREYRKTIVGSRKGSPEDVIHAAWYCIDGGQSRIQDFDLEIIRALADELPVIIVLTQCVDEERPAGLEHTLAQDDPPVEGPPVRTLASARRIAGKTLAPKGLEELVERTNDILPEAVRRAFINAQGVVIRLKANQSRTIVAASSVAAGGVGAAPIPVPDAAVLMPVQLGMLAGVTAIFGIEMTNEGAGNLIRGLVGSGGMAVAGRQIATTLLKVIPGVNLINAAVATALTAALGEAYIQLCGEMLRRQAVGKPMPEAEMLPFLLDAYQKAFKKPTVRRTKPGKTAAV